MDTTKTNQDLKPQTTKNSSFYGGRGGLYDPVYPPKKCTIVCLMVLEKSTGKLTEGNKLVKLEIEGKPQIVDQVVILLSLKFSVRINFHGGVGYASFTQETTLTPSDINVIHFRVFDIGKIKNNRIVLDGAIIHITLSPRILTSSRSWVHRLKVDLDYNSDEDSNDDDC